MAAAANAYQAASAVAAVAGKGGSGTLAAAEAGVGFKSASSSADSHRVVSQGSTLQAGGNLSLTSTAGDIHVVQGNLSAGNTLRLDSAGDIALEAGRSQMQDKSNSRNAGVEVGMGAAVGAQTGVYAYAEASVGSSKSNASSSTWHSTTLSGQHIVLNAEGDTTLRGATATAGRIDLNTGGTLTIESLQDLAQSESDNSQVGGRVQVSFGTAWDVSGYASGGQAGGNYQAVGEQSGLFAGDGGYHVNAGHVNLIGGAIASTNAGNSELSAQTLTFSDLHNTMAHQASSGSISGGFGGGAGDYQGSSTTLGKVDGGSFGGGVTMTESGSGRSTTHATLTEGNITIGGQQTTAAGLGINTDAGAAHRALDALPNAEQQLANQQAMAAAMGTVVGTSKQIAGDIQAHQANKAADAYFAGLSSEEQTRFVGLDAAAQDRELSANSPAYNDAKQWGIGGANSRALEAVTTLLVGATSGQGGGQVAANALAPYAAQLIGERFDENHGSDPNPAAQLLSHALLGALLAEVNGGNAASGAGAAADETGHASSRDGDLGIGGKRGPQGTGSSCSLRRQVPQPEKAVFFLPSAGFRGKGTAGPGLGPAVPGWLLTPSARGRHRCRPWRWEWQNARPRQLSRLAASVLLQWALKGPGQPWELCDEQATAGRSPDLDCRAAVGPVAGAGVCRGTLGRGDHPAAGCRGGGHAAGRGTGAASGRRSAGRGSGR